ncbi:oxaloacetate tautomerase FAHD1, mitochondrial [Mustelus asterias]
MSMRDLHSFWEWGRKIVCVGRNYAEHARELGNPLPGAEPLLFLKPPSAYLRPGSAIRPPRYSRRLQPEVELGLVLAKGGSCIPQEEAMGHLGGYALCLDMTARDTQEECKKKGHPWTLAKAFDCSCPVSDFIPKDRLPDPHGLTLWLKVNGQLRQQGHTSQMIFPIPYLISYISGIIRLEAGDLILTGTPAGVSDVQEHDELQAGIDDLVTMTFKVKRD